MRHLLKAKEMLGMRLCVLHNLYFYNTMMEEIRDAIDEADSILIRKKSCTVWDRSTARKKNRTAKNKLIIKFGKCLSKKPILCIIYCNVY